MPNPRVGTVTMDVVNAVKGAKGGSVEFRVEKAGIVHAGVGKASFTEKALAENIKAFVDAVREGEAAGREGHVREEGFDQLDHGARREDRRAEPQRRASAHLRGQRNSRAASASRRPR